MTESNRATNLAIDFQLLKGSIQESIPAVAGALNSRFGVQQNGVGRK